MESIMTSEKKSVKNNFFYSEAKYWVEQFGGPPFDFESAYELPADIEDYYKQTLINAVSIIIPIGERFFLSNIADYSNSLDLSDEQNEAARIFMIQESAHSRHHLAYNRKLCEARGYNLDKLVFAVKFNLDEVHRHESVKYRLALTAASEHLTCVIAEMILRSPEWLDTISDSFKSLLRWHSIEEVDHRAYAYDLYFEHYPDVEYLHETMHDFGPRMLRFFEDIACKMVALDGYNAKEFKQWMFNSKFMTAPDGPLNYFIKAMQCFFDDGFHPEKYVSFDIIKN